MTTDAPDIPAVPSLLGQLTAAFGARIEQIHSADDLEQAFADRHTLRVIGLKYDVMLAARADQMGPRGRDVASTGSGWSPHTITRLAMLLELPEQLWRPDVPLGVYWQILNSDLSFKEQCEMLTWAINNEASVADVKAKMGDEPERTGGSVVHCEAVEQNGRTVLLDGEELQAIELKGHPVSVRRLKR